MTPSYPHAPITEAIIEIKFATPLDPSDVDKINEKFGAYYPQHQNVETVDINLNLTEIQSDKATAQLDRAVGHRRASVDMTELLVIWRPAFVISQLAPYPGWDSFSQRFLRDWAVWKRVVGFREISRIGVRYMNRIDIPVAGPIVENEAFLNVYPKMPDVFGPLAAYAIQAVVPIEELGCKLTLNSGAIPSPILNHASFILDQDIAKEIDPPQSDDAIYELLSKIRIQKNKVFEACITDRARELFNK